VVPLYAITVVLFLLDIRTLEAAWPRVIAEAVAGAC
jgi:hypothetical protein